MRFFALYSTILIFSCSFLSASNGKEQEVILNTILEGSKPLTLRIRLRNSSVDTRLPLLPMVLAEHGTTVRLDLLRVLLEFGASVNVKRTTTGQSLLGVLLNNPSLTKQSKISAVLFLLNHGALISDLSEREQTALGKVLNDSLLRAIAFGQQEEVSDILSLRFASSILAPESIEVLKIAFVMAAGQGHLPIVKQLYRHFRNYMSSSRIRTALIQAAFAGHVPIVQWLLQRQKQAILKGKLGSWGEALSEALFQSAVQGHVSVVRLLLAFDANHRIGVDTDRVVRRINYFLERQPLSGQVRKSYTQILALIKQAQEGRTAQILKELHLRGLPQLPREIAAHISGFIGLRQ